MPKSQLATKMPSALRLSSQKIRTGIKRGLGLHSDGAVKKFLKNVPTVKKNFLLNRSYSDRTMHELRQVERAVRKEAEKEGMHVRQSALKQGVERVHKDAQKQWEEQLEEIREKTVRYNAGQRLHEEGRAAMGNLEKMRQRSMSIRDRDERTSGMLHGREGYGADVSVAHDDVRSSALSPKTAARPSVAGSGSAAGNLRDQKPTPVSSFTPDRKI